MDALYNVIGVAKPRAQGQAITRTEIAISNDRINSVLTRKCQYKNVDTLKRRIPGTKNWVILSKNYISTRKLTLFFNSPMFLYGV